MRRFRSIKYIALVFTLPRQWCTAQELVCSGDLCSVNPRLEPTKLLDDFPTALQFDNSGNSTNDEDDPFNQIMCPMMRLLRRSGMLHQSWFHPHYSIASVVAAMSNHLGFRPSPMVGLAKGISAGQLATFSTFPGFVNLHQLDRAVGVSHASGYTFDGNSTRFSPETFGRTMAALRELQDEHGRLTFENLQLVKLEMAQERGVGVSIPSGLETGFVWTICAGPERGYVETTDVARFLTGHMPLTIGQPNFLRWDW